MKPHVSYLGIQNGSYTEQCCIYQGRYIPRYGIGEGGIEVGEERDIG